MRLIVSTKLIVGLGLLVLVGYLAANHPVSGAGPALISVVLFSVPAFLALRSIVGTKKALALMGLFGLYALVVESIGIATGFPYGSFSYSDSLGPKVLGLTPIAVSLAWSPILLAGHAVGRTASKGQLWRHLFVGTAAMVLIDLALDPGAVHASYWAWEQPGPYYGVPWVNFLGWILTSVPALWISWKLIPESPRQGALASSTVINMTFWLGYLAAAGLFFPAIVAFLATIVLLRLWRTSPPLGRG